MNDEIIDTIIRIAPPFAKVPRVNIEAWVEMAEMFVCSTRFKERYPKAMALYTLHLMTLDGAAKGEKESVADYSRRLASFTLTGEFSQTFASLSGDSKSIRNTPWGKMYEALNRKMGGGFGLITTPRGGC